MNSFYQQAPLDTKARIVTLFYVVLIIVLLVSAPLWAGILVAALLIGIIAPFVVRGYTISGEHVIVHHFGWRREFPLAQLADATLDPGALVSSIRTFGIGGVMGYIGRFHNSLLGPYLAYVTNAHNAVVLKFSNRTLVLSPSDPADFLTALQGHISG